MRIECPHIARKGVCTKPHCSYAHSKAELVSTSAFMQTKLCNNPENCTYGVNCRYAHDPSELRGQVVLPGKDRVRGVPNFGMQQKLGLTRDGINYCIPVETEFDIVADKRKSVGSTTTSGVGSTTVAGSDSTIFVFFINGSKVR